MRLTRLFCVLALFLLASNRLAQASEAAAPPAEPSDSAPLQLPAGLSSVPEPNFMTACSASFSCGDGNTASCTGNNSCTVIWNGVKCDGTTYRCPNYCIVYEQCYCGGTLQCASNVGSCSTGDDTVTCDGHQINCPNFCL